MFTGIVIHQGSVRRSRHKDGVLDIELEAPGIAKELRRGDSVAVNGVCLTATAVGRRRFAAQAVPETLARSTLGDIRKGSRVNLELPARLSDRLGGHLVQGHVDGTAHVVRVEDDHGARRVWLGAEDDILGYLAPKGSVALDGVSLTVVDVGRTTFQVAIIPHTLEITTLGHIEEDSQVNVEVDVIAKYVERLMERR
jgi:riboflavin synthase